MTASRQGAADSNHASNASSSSVEIAWATVKHGKGWERETAAERSRGLTGTPEAFLAYDRSAACSRNNRPMDSPVPFSDATGTEAFRLHRRRVRNMIGKRDLSDAEA